MQRRWLALLLVAASGLVGSPARPAPPARPNIIFILTDDQRWDALGAAGNRIIKTPNLDRLAAQGVLFTNSFDTTPVCYASRATLLTGQFNRRHGVDSFEEQLSSAAFARTYPVLLRQSGYYTGFVGKWGLGGELPADAFDEWAGFAGQGSYFEPGDPRHLTRRQGEQAAAFVKTAREPFLLTVAFKAPHVQDGGCSCTLPIDPVDEHLYDRVRIPTPRTATEAAFQALPAFLRASEGRVRWHDQVATPEAAQSWTKDYYRLITGMDREVGRIVAALAKRGVRERTLIVFASDNGLLIGEHGLTGKWLMYEESIRTPLLVSWPGLPARRLGKKVSAMALNVDVAPTLLDAAGVPIPPETQGRSLRPLVFGEPTDWRQDWFFEHHLIFPHIPESEGVRGVRFKYVRYTSEEPVYEQLFDLASDPYEEQDILHTPAVFDQRPWYYRRILSDLRQRWLDLHTALE
jgi:arylsulfatase A-like enzyme